MERIITIGFASKWWTYGLESSRYCFSKLLIPITKTTIYSIKMFGYINYSENIPITLIPYSYQKRNFLYKFVTPYIFHPSNKTRYIQPMSKYWLALPLTGVWYSTSGSRAIDWRTAIVRLIYIHDRIGSWCYFVGISPISHLHNTKRLNILKKLT